MARNPGDAPAVQDVLIPHRDHKQFYPQMMKNANLALMNLIRQVSFKNKRFDPELLDPSAQLVGGSDPGGTNAKDKVWRTGYEMLVPVTTNWPPGAGDRSGTPVLKSGQPDLVISKIATQQRDLVNFFTFGLTSAQVAALRPRLRIYKLHYEMDPPNGSKPRWTLKEPRALKPAPLGEMEIIFDEAVSEADYGAILGNHASGYMVGTGLKSFSWKLQGVNPGEIDNNIEASLKVYFSNVSDLFTMQSILATDASGAPIRQATFLDLVTYSLPPGNTALADNCLQDEYDGSFFEIRVDVGYQVPAESNILFTAAERDFVEESQRSLFLQLTDHVFEFNEDGSATMQANYRARYALNTDRYDLLKFQSDPAIQTHQENLDDLRADRHDQEQDGGPTDYNEDNITRQEKELGTLLEEKYRYIMEELLIKHVYQTYVPETLLLLSSNTAGSDLNLGGSATRRQHEAAGSSFNTGQYDDEDGEKATSIARPRDLYRFMFGSPTGQYNQTFFDNVIKPLQDSYQNAVQNLDIIGPRSYSTAYNQLARTSGVEEMVTSVLDEDGDPLRRGGRAYQVYGHSNDFAGALGHNTESDRTKTGPLVQFFYLGDILEVFLLTQGLTSEIQSKRLGFITTDFEFLNPWKMLGGYQNSAGHWEDSHQLVRRPSGASSNSHGHTTFSPTLSNIKCGLKSLGPSKREHYTTTANLCHIPIEVGLFMDFMKRKIVDGQRVTYYVEEFIRDLLNEYVKPIYNQAVIVQSRNSPIPSVVTAETDKNIQFFAQDHQSNAAYGYNVGYDRGPTPRKIGHGAAQGVTGEHSTTADFRRSAFVGGSDENAAGPRDQDDLINFAGGLQTPVVSNLHTIGGDIAMFVPVVTNSTVAGAPAAASGFPGGGQARNTVLRKPNNAADAATIKIISFQKNFVPYDGHYLNNLQKGIANFIVGLDRGLVKKVTFDRVDQPYLRESRAAKSRGAGAAQLRELYHCNLTLVGNSLLLPGQLIYVEPNMTIFGRPTDADSISRKLGMGGYHLVIDVNNEIENNWETTVKALHVSMPSIQSALIGTVGPTVQGVQHVGTGTGTIPSAPFIPPNTGIP